MRRLHWLLGCRMCAPLRCSTRVIVSFRDTYDIYCFAFDVQIWQLSVVALPLPLRLVFVFAQAAKEHLCRQFDEYLDTLDELLDEHYAATAAQRKARRKGPQERLAAEKQLADANLQLEAFKRSPQSRQLVADMRELLLQFPELAPKYGAAAPSLVQVSISGGSVGGALQHRVLLM